MDAAEIALLFLAVLSVGLSGYAVWRDEPLAWRFAASPAQSDEEAPDFETVFDYAAPAGQAHAPAIVLRGAGFDLLWFEGSREGADDVDIRFATLLRGDGDDAWRQVSGGTLMTPQSVSEAFEPRQLVSTLGNTIANETERDRLFVTVVSVGGWAMAAVADVSMRNGGPVSARKLNLSPFLNRSVLVRSPALRYADGGLALPAYFEMGRTHGLLVRLARSGRVRDTRRIAGPVRAIQPMIVPLDDRRAVAFLRDYDPAGRLLISRTNDGGQSWSGVERTGIPNPSAPVAALGLGGGRILMAMNDDAAAADRLNLAVSEDEGTSWRVIRTLEDDGGDARYPMLRWLKSGDIALAYSYGSKGGIRAHVFNTAWVASR